MWPGQPGPGRGTRPPPPFTMILVRQWAGNPAGGNGKWKIETEVETVVAGIRMVTGAAGLVGRAVVPMLRSAGHRVVATDLPGAVPAADVHADLADAGQAGALLGGTAFTPWCTRQPPFARAASVGVRGLHYATRRFLPDYLPIDEEHPLRPQDPYGLSKLLGEQLCDAAVRRSDLRCISLRPAWVQDAASYAADLGPLIRAGRPRGVAGWPYIDVGDLPGAVRLAVESDLPGHRPDALPTPAPPPTCGPSPGRTPAGSTRVRRSGCWAGKPPEAGATT
jgi:hypothetical protein